MKMIKALQKEMKNYLKKSKKRETKNSEKSINLLKKKRKSKKKNQILVKETVQDLKIEIETVKNTN